MYGPKQCLVASSFQQGLMQETSGNDVKEESDKAHMTSLHKQQQQCCSGNDVTLRNDKPKLVHQVQLIPIVEWHQTLPHEIKRYSRSDDDEDNKEWSMSLDPCDEHGKVECDVTVNNGEPLPLPRQVASDADITTLTKDESLSKTRHKASASDATLNDTVPEQPYSPLRKSEVTLDIEEIDRNVTTICEEPIHSIQPLLHTVRSRLNGDDLTSNDDIYESAWSLSSQTDLCYATENNDLAKRTKIRFGKGQWQNDVTRDRFEPPSVLSSHLRKQWYRHGFRRSLEIFKRSEKKPVSVRIPQEAHVIDVTRDFNFLLLSDDTISSRSDENCEYESPDSDQAQLPRRLPHWTNGSDVTRNCDNAHTNSARAPFLQSLPFTTYVFDDAFEDVYHEFESPVPELPAPSQRSPHRGPGINDVTNRNDESLPVPERHAMQQRSQYETHGHDVTRSNDESPPVPERREMQQRSLNMTRDNDVTSSSDESPPVPERQAMQQRSPNVTRGNDVTGSSDESPPVTEGRAMQQRSPNVTRDNDITDSSDESPPVPERQAMQQRSPNVTRDNDITDSSDESPPVPERQAMQQRSPNVTRDNDITGSSDESPPVPERQAMQQRSPNVTRDNDITGSSDESPPVPERQAMQQRSPIVTSDNDITGSSDESPPVPERQAMQQRSPNVTRDNDVTCSSDEPPPVPERRAMQQRSPNVTRNNDVTGSSDEPPPVPERRAMQQRSPNVTRDNDATGSSDEPPPVPERQAMQQRSPNVTSGIDVTDFSDLSSPVSERRAMQQRSQNVTRDNCVTGSSDGSPPVSERRAMQQRSQNETNGNDISRNNDAVFVDPKKENVSKETYSDVVTVKAGDWEKGCHWSVLRVSPFFYAAQKHDSIERRTDVIEFKACLQPFLEKIVNVLYGNEITITEQNVWGLIYMTEFLQMFTFKERCTSWLRTLPITLDNYMSLLEIATIYDICLPELQEYIKGQLFTLMETDDFVMICPDSLMWLQNITCYVPDSQWIRFIAKWIISAVEREPAIHQSLYFPSINDLDKVLHESRDYDVSGLLNQLKDLEKETETYDDEVFEVVLFPKRTDINFVLAYSPSHDCIFQVNTRVPSTTRPKRLNPLIGSYGMHSPIIYRGNAEFPIRGIEIQNLVTNSYTETDFIDESNNMLNNISNVSFCGDMCVAIDGLPCPGMEMSATEPSLTTTVYKGNVKEGTEQTTMRPAVTLMRKDIENMAMNLSDCVAFTTRRKEHVILFDERQGILELLSIELTEMSRQWYQDIVGTSSGFIVYCPDKICVIIQTGSRHTPFVTQTIDINSAVNNSVFCDDTFFFSLKKQTAGNHLNSGFRFYFTDIGSIAKISNNSAYDYPVINLPDTTGWSPSKLLGDAVYVTSLPKSALRCEYDCPHCRQLEIPVVSGHCITRFNELQANII